MQESNAIAEVNPLPQPLQEIVNGVEASRRLAKKRSWISFAIGLVLLLLCLSWLYPSVRGTYYAKIVLPEPASPFLSEVDMGLLTSRRAFTVSDNSVWLQQTLYRVRQALRENPQDEGLKLYRFYLVYVAVLSPDHIAYEVDSKRCDKPALIRLVRNARDELAGLKLDTTNRAWISSQLQLSAWLLHELNTPAERSQRDLIWQTLTSTPLASTLNGLECQMFFLHHILNRASYFERRGGGIWLNGKPRTSESIELLLENLSKQRNALYKEGV